MTDALAIHIGQEALLVVATVAGPLIGFGLLVGLLVSVFQATTQINEQTLSFAPRIAAVFLAALVLGPWMLHLLLAFARGLIDGIPGWTR